MIYLRQSTASQEIPLGYFVDSTDGNTEETGLTIANTDIKLWKMGGTTLANKNSGGATHISNGVYYAVLDATDTDTLGSLIAFVHVSGALTVRVECCVLAANVYDSFIAGTDYFDVSTVQISGSAVSTSSAQIGVNVVNAAGTAWGSGAITSGAFATGAITAGAIAADAIGASELAADAVTEIAGGVWNAARASYTSAGSFGEGVASVQGNVTGSVTTDYAKYLNASIWFDDISGTTGTTAFTNGIYTNPSSNESHVGTLLSSVGLKTVCSRPRSTFQMAGGFTYDGYNFCGENWSLSTSGSRSISGCYIAGALNVSGTFTGASAPHFERCAFTGATTIPASILSDCTMVATLTFGTGDYSLVNCQSGVAGSGSPVIDCNSPGAAQNISIRRWSGGLTFNNINANSTISIDVVSGGTITLNGANGNVQIRGTVQVTDNRTGSPTLGSDSVINKESIADAVWDDLTANHTTAGTTGKALSDAGSAGDPWGTSVPGAYGAGTAGYILGTNLDATVSSRSTLTAAAVNTEMVDALNVDTYAEPGSGAPGATISLAAKIGYLYKAFRNKITQTSTTYTLYADDTTTAHHTATVSDDSTTFTRGEVGGP